METIQSGANFSSPGGSAFFNFSKIFKMFKIFEIKTTGKQSKVESQSQMWKTTKCEVSVSKTIGKISQKWSLNVKNMLKNKHNNLENRQKWSLRFKNQMTARRSPPRSVFVFQRFFETETPIFTVFPMLFEIDHPLLLHFPMVLGIEPLLFLISPILFDTDPHFCFFFQSFLKLRLYFCSFSHWFLKPRLHFCLFSQ